METAAVSSVALRRPSRLWLVAGVSWRALKHFPTHLRVTRFLRSPAFVDTVQDNPKFAFKYLTDSYLVNGLAIKDRAECFLHHYEVLYQRLPDRVLRQLLNWGIDLCEFSENGVRFALRCALSRPCGKEGELSLVLFVEGKLLSSISFTFVPGHVANSDHREIILISRIQGEPGLPDEIVKTAQQALHRMRFGSVLMAGLEGIALAFAVPEIACVSSLLHIAYVSAYADHFRHAYEELLLEKGFSQSETGFFRTEVPMKERSNAEIRGNHRSRAKAKRLLRQRVAGSCRDYFESVLQSASEASDTHWSFPARSEQEASVLSETNQADCI
jgi:uncharacterized protein VirK/YbjX